MTQENKELLLKDLCGRLPYGVQCSCTWSHEVPNGTTGCIQELSTFLIDEIEIIDNPEYDCQICDVKPYLRPMSSMSEKEEWKYNYIKENHTNWEAYDYLNSIHIDYRGLISMNLALEAPKDMYNTKTE